MGECIQMNDSVKRMRRNQGVGPGQTKPTHVIVHTPIRSVLHCHPTRFHFICHLYFSVSPMSTMMNDQATFYQLSVHSRGFHNTNMGDNSRPGHVLVGGHTLAPGRHSHGFLNSQSAACYYACAENPGFGGQPMSVVEEEQHPLENIHPAFSQHFMNHHQLHHLQQPHGIFNGADGSNIHSGRPRQSCLQQNQQSSQHHHHHQQCLHRPNNVLHSHFLDSRTPQPARTAAADNSPTPTPAHLPRVCTSNNTHLDHPTLLPGLHSADPPPAHNHNIGHTTPPAVITSEVDTPHQQQQHQQQQQPLPFPWMKTTKSHAHQWKAQWPGRWFVV